ncbi:hypothetical protein MTBBW1_1430010 [Desulfamplus magnetovallimortis]|uniref:Uncharacterized protein n=1 Tax=Desulfamplus magnetovallimortis TaxID=1246637 RepID=A0A1W1H8D0_9BACT|nr:hypothetical protein MTBBW1_1430010 [Desulfamplus magnetovallimortis]
MSRYERCLFSHSQQPIYENTMACFISQFTLSGEKILGSGNLSQKSVKYLWSHMKDANTIMKNTKGRQFCLPFSLL